jgi:hypothetical protein
LGSFARRGRTQLSEACQRFSASQAFRIGAIFTAIDSATVEALRSQKDIAILGGWPIAVSVSAATTGWKGFR